MARILSKCIAVLVLMLSWGAVASGQTLSGATLTVSGAEQSSGGVWDSGSVTVTVNGYTRTYSGLSGYGRYSDVGSVASLIAEHLSTDTAAPVWAKSVGPVITFVGRAGQPVTASATTAYDTSHFGGPSFTFTSGSTTVTPTPFLSLHCTRTTMGTSDTANCIAAIEGTSTLYGAHAATNSMAFQVNSVAWTSVPVGTDGTATAMGLTESSDGTYTVRADYPADGYYSAMHATTTITVGSTPSSSGVYNYSITGPSGSGYDPAGNISAYADSINGQWTLGYDSLNRVQAASSSPAIKPGTPYLCWSYDAFGNRKQQYFGSSAFSGGGTSACSGGGSTTATQDQNYSTSNRLVSDSTISTSFSYDASGNMTSDGSGGHQYAYDAEGRVCAMSTGISPIYYWGYLYDAEGHRVAKGSISSLDCSLVNGDSFAVTEYYVIGPDGAPMTVLDGSGNWKHTDVPAGPSTMAVYDGDGLHFRLSDWLGTHRVQTDYKGDTPVEDAYQSLPFGELLGSSAGATQKHFTGKEHDDESGLDYFGARYYSSNMGRWLIPDWSAKVEPIPYSKLEDPQTLNLYGYVRNHPITAVDADGHQEPIPIPIPLPDIPLGPITISANPDKQLQNIGKQAYDDYQAEQFIKNAAAHPSAPAIPTGIAGAVPIGASTPSADKPSTLVPGPHAGASIPARSPDRNFTQDERGKIDTIGNSTGCHTCGTTNPGTQSGHFVPDHQPVSSLNVEGKDQRLYPHCLHCSQTQGGEANAAKNNPPASQEKPNPEQ